MLVRVQFLLLTVLNSVSLISLEWGGKARAESPPLRNLEKSQMCYDITVRQVRGSRLVSEATLERCDAECIVCLTCLKKIY